LYREDCSKGAKRGRENGSFGGTVNFDRILEALFWSELRCDILHAQQGNLGSQG